MIALSKDTDLQAQDPSPQQQAEMPVLLSPTYDVPAPYGVPAANDAMGSIAAPLFAGFCIAFIGLVVQAEDSLRLPDLVLLLEAIALVFLIVSVECSYWARRFSVTPSEISDWWPDQEHPARQAMLRREQFSHQAGFKLWGRRAALAYNLGTLFLLLGIAVAMIPKATMTFTRLSAFIIVMLGFAYQSLWIVSAWLTTTERFGWIADRLKVLNYLSNRFAPQRFLVEPPPVFALQVKTPRKEASSSVSNTE